MVEPISAQDFTAVYCVKCLYEFFWWLPAIKYRVVMTPDSAILWRAESKFQILFVFSSWLYKNVDIFIIFDYGRGWREFRKLWRELWQRLWKCLFWPITKVIYLITFLLLLFFNPQSVARDSEVPFSFSNFIEHFLQLTTSKNWSTANWGI